MSEIFFFLTVTQIFLDEDEEFFSALNFTELPRCLVLPAPDPVHDLKMAEIELKNAEDGESCIIV